MVIPSSGQVSHVLLTRSPLAHEGIATNGEPVRLACIRHAASVRPEPGSNSPSKPCHSIARAVDHEEPAPMTTTVLFGANWHTIRMRNCSGRLLSQPFHTNLWLPLSRCQGARCGLIDAGRAERRTAVLCLGTRRPEPAISVRQTGKRSARRGFTLAEPLESVKRVPRHTAAIRSDRGAATGSRRTGPANQRWRHYPIVVPSPTVTNGPHPSGPTFSTSSPGAACCTSRPTGCASTWRAVGGGPTSGTTRRPTA